jgi:hypothetical protein
MFDRELNELLRRYRPAAPPPDLRDRITVPIAVRRTWPWAVAAAALLLAACALQVATDRIYRTVERAATPPPVTTADQSPELREALGDDELLLIAIERLARVEREQREASEVSMPATGESWQ